MPAHQIFANLIQERVGENEFFVPFKEKVHAKRYNDAMAIFQAKFEKDLREEARKYGCSSEAQISDYIARHLKRKMETQAHKPIYTNVGPYKLHVTLAEESYTPEVRAHIQFIIEKYSHAVSEYKYVDAEKLRGDLDYLNRCIPFLNAIKVKIGKEEALSVEEKESFAEIMHRYEKPGLHTTQKWGTWRTIKLEDINALTKSVTDEQAQQNRACDRFLKGDQFTIYIPPQCDKESILRMCQEINQFLAKQGAIPGETLKTERRLGAGINFRQELLLNDFKALYSDSRWFEYRRISARETSESTIEQIQSEMAQSELFNYLSQNIDKPAPQDKWQGIWDKASGTPYDKAVTLLLNYSGSYKSSENEKATYWGGSVGRFFKGRWGTHHGDEVQNALNQSNDTTSLQQLLDKLQDNLKNKELKPDGDLRRILNTIGANTDYGQIKEEVVEEPDVARAISPS